MNHSCPFYYKKIGEIFSLFLILTVIASCQDDDDEKADYLEIVKKTEVNSDFEHYPPLAEKIEIEVLKKPLSTGENLRVFVDFENSNIEQEYLAINLGDDKIVLRDDGKGSDEKAKDRNFSIFLKEDIASLVKELKNRKEIILSEKAPTFTFKDRMAIPIQIDLIEKFDPEIIEKHGIWEIPRDILFPNLPVFIRHQRSLTITAPAVLTDPERTFDPCTQVGNPNGVWTFGALMRQLASTGPTSIATDAEVSDFVKNWLEIWLSNETVNGSEVRSRTLMDEYVIAPWLFRSQMAGAPTGQLKMEFAPFRLVAIVNRLDLRGNMGYSLSDAGEGRFIYQIIPSSCYRDEFPDGPFEGPDGALHVILEYGINKKSCSSIKAYAREWADLSTMIPGTDAYNSALENITNQFTQSGTNPARTNQSSLNQIRTNENGLTLPWELREFKLSESGELNMVPVKMEPIKIFNGHSENTLAPEVIRFAAYVNSNSINIVNNNYEVPLQISVTQGVPTPVRPFLAGSSINLGSSGGINHWDGSSNPGPAYITNNEARHIFSLNTCSGCHGRETNTTSFIHLGSGFLTGITVSDAANRPSGSPTTRTFNDLARREMDLSNLINSACIDFDFFELSHLLLFKPLNMVH